MSETAQCEKLLKAQQYEELFAAATEQSAAQPLEEAYYLYTFKALNGLGMHRLILSGYQKMARLWAEELGAEPSEETRALYDEARGKVSSIEQDIISIQNDLHEAASASQPQGEPLFCGYQVFKYLYKMLARSGERTGAKILVVLVSVQNAAGGPLPEYQILSAAMNDLRDVVFSHLLRRSDTVARYSKNQYVIMFSMDKPQGASAVIERLDIHCEAVLAGQGLKAIFTMADLEWAGLS